MTFASLVRKTVEAVVTVREVAFPTVLERHQELQRVFGLGDQHVQIMEKSAVFEEGVEVSFDGHSFAICAKKVCATEYGNYPWMDLLMVHCLDDPSLNMKAGGGTTEIYTIRADAFARLIEVLTTDMSVLQPGTGVRPVYAHWVF